MPANASSRWAWMSKKEHWPCLRQYLFEDKKYLRRRLWLPQLASPEFEEWFWAQSESQPDGCRLWRPDDFSVTIDGWSESPERLAWCLKHGHEPGSWLGLLRICPLERCVNPDHQYFSGRLIRLYRRVRWDKESGCWLWQGAKTRDGYGRVWFAGHEFLAHRLTYAYEYGPVWSGQVVYHRCDTPACVNPDHLVRGTQRDNVADMVAKGRQARGERHPQARVQPEVAWQAIDFRLSGVPVQDITQILPISPSTLRTLIRGEHWRLHETQSVYGEPVDLREVTVYGRISGLATDRRLNADGSLVRFQVELDATAGQGGKRRAVTAACSGALRDDQRATLERLQSSHSEVVVKGRLHPYTDSEPAGRRRPAIEIALTHVEAISDTA